MSDESDSITPTPARAGSGADLARRMDRMEDRQDNMEKTLANLSGTVARVELNQKHAEELNLLRHDALKTGLDSLTGIVGTFITRIEGIIDGTVQTAQTRQGAEVMAQYLKFVEKTNQRLDTLEDTDDKNAARNAGRGDVLSWGKVAVITVSPVIAVIITILTLLKGTVAP